VPVEVGGLSVEPGDLLHGDANGVVIVPLAVADTVPAEADRVLAREAELVRLIGRKGVTLAELKAGLGVDSH
jgi:regulator of RNase E activity RraA